MKTLKLTMAPLLIVTLSSCGLPSALDGPNDVEVELARCLEVEPVDIKLVLNDQGHLDEMEYSNEQEMDQDRFGECLLRLNLQP